MTVRPLRKPEAEAPPLTVVSGGGKSRRFRAVLWVAAPLLAVSVFMSLIFMRTALDQSIYELRNLNGQIAEETARRQQLRLEITRLSSPTVILPAAEELGLILPERVVPLTPLGLVRESAEAPAGFRDDDPTRDAARSASGP